jgi:hypothetical protein
VTGPVTPQITALAGAAQRFVGPSTPFRYLFVAFTVGIVGWYWLARQGPFRAAAQRGGWRLPTAVWSSLGMLLFGVGIALGHLLLGIVALLAGGLPGTVLVLEVMLRTPRR